MPWRIAEPASRRYLRRWKAAIFASNGLEPELVYYHGHPNSLKALIAGEAEFTNAVGAELLLANHRHNSDAVVLASAISRSAQQVAARAASGRARTCAANAGASRSATMPTSAP